MIRVLLVHDHALTRESLYKVLRGATDVNVVGQAAEADQALAAARKHDPDVIVMGLVPRGLDTQAPVKQRHSQVPLIVFKPQPKSINAGRLLHNRALGYICPPLARLDLVQAVRVVHAGKPYVCRHLKRALELARAEERQTPKRLSQLTKRELQLLRELATGKPNREIARALGLSPKTVSTHRMHILSKLGFHSNVDLARFAIEHNLLGD